MHLFSSSLREDLVASCRYIQIYSLLHLSLNYVRDEENLGGLAAKTIRAEPIDSVN